MQLTVLSSEDFPPLKISTDIGMNAMEACQKPAEGNCLADLYVHSHMSANSGWWWIRRGALLESSLGFQAT
jgi:hypothetical protein